MRGCGRAKFEEVRGRGRARFEGVWGRGWAIMYRSFALCFLHCID